MSTDKGYAEFVLGTYKALLVDCAFQYPRLAKEFDRDYSRLSSALEHHGIHFFMDVMPAYRKHFDQCLAKQRLTLTPLINFGSWKRKGGMVPRLFRGLFLRVFELNGELRVLPDENAIRLIRQLLGAVRKVRMTSSTRDTCKSVDEFYQIEKEIFHGSQEFWGFTEGADGTGRLASRSFTDLKGGQQNDPRGSTRPDPQQLSLDLREEEEITSSTVTVEHLDKVQRVADLISSVLGVFNPEQWKPKHGPGAVSDQHFGSYKYDFKTWPDRLEYIFPYDEFAFANSSLWADEPLIQEAFHGLNHEKPAKLHAVPKVLSKPRLIASEPTCLQWCQQIVRDFLYDRTQNTIVGDFIDFRRQDLNGKLALEASHHQTHATIDLSSASDYVSCWHVERLFRRAPTLLDALRTTRSLWIKQEISRTSPKFSRLRKYSTMGNATTFPVQSILFLAMALGTLLYVRNLPVTIEQIKRLGKDQVRIFGDDIIIPADVSWSMVELLEAFKMKVNRHKTFLEGNFRESCGVDAYDGHNVTTISILDVPRRAAPGSIVSTVDVHHNLLDGGYYATSAYLRKTAERCGYDKIRTVKHRSGFFGWSDMCDLQPRVLRTRWNGDRHIREVLCTTLRVKAKRSTSVEKHGLLQFFTEAQTKVTSSISRLGYLTRRPQARLCLGWEPVLS